MTSSIDAGIKCQEPSEVAKLGREFLEYWDSHFANAPLGSLAAIIIASKHL